MEHTFQLVITRVFEDGDQELLEDEEESESSLSNITSATSRLHPYAHYPQCAQCSPCHSLLCVVIVCRAMSCTSPAFFYSFYSVVS